MSVPSAWYPDPQNPVQQRWWDGNAWTAHVRAPAHQAQQSPTQPHAPAQQQIQTAAGRAPASPTAAAEAATSPTGVGEDPIFATPVYEALPASGWGTNAVAFAELANSRIPPKKALVGAGALIAILGVAGFVLTGGRGAAPAVPVQAPTDKTASIYTAPIADTGAATVTTPAAGH